MPWLLANQSGNFFILLKIRDALKTRGVGLFLAMLFGFTMMAQPKPLEALILLPTGEYSSAYLIDTIEKTTTLKLSYASRSLLREKLQITEPNPPVEYLLMSLFDNSQYHFLVKQGKILVAKRAGASTADQITVSGFVEDHESHERLIGANVYVAQTNLGTVTNTYGFFSLRVPRSDTLRLMASLIGYQDAPVTGLELRDTNFTILLKTKSEELEEVTVTAEESVLLNPRMSTVVLKPREIKMIPALFGEVDVLKVIQLLPGVQMSSELSTSFVVRGGSIDQNLILLDGVPVYNASHLFGFFSVFNPDATKNIQLTKGGFPARFGGRLSSVLEIDMKEGNLENYHGAGSVGLLASKLMLEGPIIKNRASFMVSGRRTYSDLLYRPFLNRGSDGGYYFGDFNSKINYVFSRKDRLYVSYYHGIDKAFAENSNDGIFEGKLMWGNSTAAVRWNRLYSEKLFGNLTATYSRYNFKISALYDNTVARDYLSYFSRVTDVGVRYDIEHIINSRHRLRYGTSYTYHIFQPGAMQFTLENDSIDLDSLLQLAPKTFANDLYLYVEDEYTVSPKLKFNLGLHHSVYQVRGRWFNSLQPRVSGRYLIFPQLSVKASYAFMKQYIHLLTNSGSGLPTDLWVTSTDIIPPQNAHQVATGISHNFKKRDWELGMEVYYKYFSDLIAYKEAASFAPATDWQTQVVEGGIGRAYGWESFFRVTEGRTTGWVAYTLSRSERQFDELNDGRFYPDKYDRRHDLKLVFNQEFSKGFNFSACWIFNTGTKATIPISTYIDADGREVIKYSDRNAFSYPNYHRLDVSFNWNHETGWGNSTWSFSLYNAYNRRNPFFIFFTTRGGERQANQLSVMPIMPSLSYSFQF